MNIDNIRIIILNNLISKIKSYNKYIIATNISIHIGLYRCGYEKWQISYHCGFWIHYLLLLFDLLNYSTSFFFSLFISRHLIIKSRLLQCTFSLLPCRHINWGFKELDYNTTFQSLKINNEKGNNNNRFIWQLLCMTMHHN